MLLCQQALQEWVSAPRKYERIGSGADELIGVHIVHMNLYYVNVMMSIHPYKHCVYTHVIM